MDCAQAQSTFGAIHRLPYTIYLKTIKKIKKTWNQKNQSLSHRNGTKNFFFTNVTYTDELKQKNLKLGYILQKSETLFNLLSEHNHLELSEDDRLLF
jgi:hypothetical protein